MSDVVDVENPARPSEVVGTVELTGVNGVAEQLDAVAGGGQEWAAAAPEQRIDQIRKALAPLAADRDALVTLLVRENGKTRREAEVDVAGLAGMLEATAAFAAALDPRDLTTDKRTLRLLRKPLGVVLLLVPSNAPVALAAAHLMPALVAGNTALVKVPLQCPLVVSEMLRRLSDGLPAGVLQVVTARDADVSDVLIGDRRVRKIGLTGGSRSALSVVHAMKDVKEVLFELGGNDATVILDDVEITDALADRLTAASLSLTGQYCSAIKRVYVHRSRAATLAESLTAAFDRVVVGDGLDPEVSMGPLGSRSALAGARDLVRRTRESGMTVLERGSISDADQFAAGWFMRPTLVLDAQQGSDVVQTEQFAPVLPIVVFDDDEEALRMANDTTFGLSGSVWSADLGRACGLADRLDVGVAIVNGTPHDTKDVQAPFGGVKESGVGRVLSSAGLEAYTTSFARLSLQR